MDAGDRDEGWESGIPRGSRSRSAVGIIEQLLQSIAERRRKSGRPGRVDQADPNQIAKVGSILVAPGDQFHPDERFELGDLKFRGALRFVDFRQVKVAVARNFLTGIEEMDSAAWIALRAIDECVDVPELMVDEAGGFEAGFRRDKVKASDQDIDIACRADGVLVNAGDLLGDGVSADHGVRHAGRVEGAGSPAQPLFDLFRCHDRPFPTDGLDCCFGHDTCSLRLSLS